MAVAVVNSLSGRIIDIIGCQGNQTQNGISRHISCVVCSHKGTNGIHSKFCFFQWSSVLNSGIILPAGILYRRAWTFTGISGASRSSIFYCVGGSTGAASIHRSLRQGGSIFLCIYDSILCTLYRIGKSKKGLGGRDAHKGQNGSDLLRLIHK